MKSLQVVQVGEGIVGRKPGGMLRVWFGKQRTVMEEQTCVMAKKRVSLKRVLGIYRILQLALKQ